MKQIVEFDTPTQLADPPNDRLPIKLEKQDSFIIIKKIYISIKVLIRFA
jgi:hypothetical protein